MVSTLSRAESGNWVRFGSESSSHSLKNSDLRAAEVLAMLLTTDPFSVRVPPGLAEVVTSFGGDLSLRTMTPPFEPSSENPESCDLVE